VMLDTLNLERIAEDPLALNSTACSSPEELDFFITPATPPPPSPASAHTFRWHTPRDDTKQVAQTVVLSPSGHPIHVMINGEENVEYESAISRIIANLSSVEDKSVDGHRHQRALLIGIRYLHGFRADFSSDSRPLGGPHADIDDMKRLLIDQFGWREQDITMMKDDGLRPERQPTKENIVREINRLVEGVEPGERLFFQFAGHGAQIKDEDGDEDDGMDEVIMSSDGQRIVDDELHDLLVKPLPQGVRLTAVFDCCHSGTGLDLPEIAKDSIYAHHVQSQGRVLHVMHSQARGATIREPNVKGKTRMCSRLRHLRHRYKPERTHWELVGTRDVSVEQSPHTDHSHHFPRRPMRKDSAGDVVLWAACHDPEDAFEVKIHGSVRGAMSYAFTQSLRTVREQTYQELLDSISKRLEAQVPELSASQPIRMDAYVTI